MNYLPPALMGGQRRDEDLKHAGRSKPINGKTGVQVTSKVGTILRTDRVTYGSAHRLT